MAEPGRQFRGGELISSEQIMQTAKLVLEGFILDQIESMAGPLLEQVLRPMFQDVYIRKLVAVVTSMARELENDKELQRLISKIRDEDYTANNFLKKAKQIFSNDITWRHIVTLFCFATKLVLKALHTSVDLPELIITSVVSWTLDFLRDQLLDWIQDQGGWVWSIMYFLTCLMNLIHLDGLFSQYGRTVTWWAVAMTVIGAGALALFRLQAK